MWFCFWNFTINLEAIEIGNNNALTLLDLKFDVICWQLLLLCGINFDKNLWALIDCWTLFGWRHCSTFNICIKGAEGIVNRKLCYICSRFVIFFTSMIMFLLNCIFKTASISSHYEMILSSFIYQICLCLVWSA